MCRTLRSVFKLLSLGALCLGALSAQAADSPSAQASAPIASPAKAKFERQVISSVFASYDAATCGWTKTSAAENLNINQAGIRVLLQSSVSSKLMPSSEATRLLATFFNAGFNSFIRDETQHLRQKDPTNYCAKASGKERVTWDSTVQMAAFSTRTVKPLPLYKVPDSETPRYTALKLGSCIGEAAKSMDDRTSDAKVVGRQVAGICHEEAYEVGKVLAASKELTPKAAEASAQAFSKSDNVAALAIAVVTGTRALDK